ncbi:sulfatase-like hydrolase/transferase [Cerasicoccus frondis]|uniref:sulfatase-like hydrolase/transferase n=1 Tax=Cerasicoccus frondis TaxID=490090 RepID=UPI002852D15A|nr:sulfatase-like hydrolase/transferase [Cerasicoccus frondis]
MNIVLITADELRGDCLGITGNPDVRTPNIDSLAKRGVVLDRHFAVFPKCVPSRCSMHTGRYTHTDGLRTVMGPNHLPEGDPNLATFLRDHGYETAVFGLNHVWMKEWFSGEGEESNKVGAGAVDYTSFTEGPLADMALRPETFPSGKARSGGHIEALRTIHYEGLEEGEVTDFSDQNRANQACYYLNELRTPDKPFFMELNLSKPHPPYQIHDPFYSMYDPANIAAFPHQLPENASLPLVAQRRWRLGNDISEASLREIQAVYYAMISFIDTLVGQVLNTLETQNLTENTLVIFTSDHGDFAGQYGINEKWDASLQDCLLRVPFIIAGPDIPSGQLIEEMTEHVDLPATILDYLHCERPQKWVWHGSSMLPVIHGRPGKDTVFADGGHEASMRERFNAPTWQEHNGRQVKTVGGKQLTYKECPDAMARCKMARTKEWKLVIRETGGNELFNVAKDPYELKNLYGSLEHSAIASDLQLKLIEWSLKTDTDRPYLEEFGA